MAEHLAYIRIHGLVGDKAEVFQGTVGAGGTSFLTPTKENPPTPDDVDTGIFNAIINLAEDLFNAHEKATTVPDTPRAMSAGSRSRLVALPTGGGAAWLFKALPYIASMAGGPLAKIVTEIVKNPGLGLVAVEAARLAVEVGDLLGEGFNDLAEDRDRNRLIEILETALLHSDGIYPFNTESSLIGDILKKGLLHLPPNVAATDDNLVSTLKAGLLELLTDPTTQQQEYHSILTELIDTLDSLDMTNDFGVFRQTMRVKIFQH